MTKILIKNFAVVLDIIIGRFHTRDVRRMSRLQSNQVKRSRRLWTNKFINGKMISFVDSIIHS